VDYNKFHQVVIPVAVAAPGEVSLLDQIPAPDEQLFFNWCTLRPLVCFQLTRPGTHLHCISLFSWDLFLGGGAILEFELRSHTC
jgi:hypothetical protein